MDISVSAYSLSTFKGGVSIFFEIEERFRTPITGSEYERFDKSLVSDASRRKWAWFLKVFKERKKQRSEAVLKEDYSSESIIQEYIGLDVGLYIG